MSRIGIQLGHCFRTSGRTGTPGCCGTTEQEMAVLVWDHLAPRLHAAGHTPVKILADPASYPAMSAFIAVHCDGAGPPVPNPARGCTFGYRTDLSNAAASKAFGDYWRGRHNARGYPGGNRPTNYTAGLSQYYALDDARNAGASRAIVVELGFLTSTADSAWLTSHVDRVALAIVDTVVHYYGGTVPQEDFFVAEWSTMTDGEKQAFFDELYRWFWRAEGADGVVRGHLVEDDLEQIAAVVRRIANVETQLNDVQASLAAIKTHLGI